MTSKQEINIAPKKSDDIGLYGYSNIVPQLANQRHIYMNFLKLFYFLSEISLLKSKILGIIFGYNVNQLFKAFHTKKSRIMPAINPEKGRKHDPPPG
jgi:hypothetical protein